MMKRFLSLLAILCLSASMLYAAILKNVPQTFIQPDGTELSCFATGDDYYHYLHDANGYTIIHNPETGYFVYAAKDGDKLVPTQYIPGVDNPAEVGLKPYINISAEQWLAKRNEFYETMMPKNGAKTVDSTRNRGVLSNIVIFIRFSGDSELTTPFATVNNMFNDSTPGANSMNNYFKAASYNKLNLKSYFYPAPANGGTTIVSYQDTYSRNYYQPYSSSNTLGYQGSTERYLREQALLKNAVDAVSSSIPASLNVDMNDDGNVDNVVFVVKGNVDGWSDLLWPHRSWLLYEYATINGKRVYDYNFQLESAPAYFTPSVLCHEMFHTLSAPDLYHYQPEGEWFSSAGSWDLMEQNANPPQHSLAYMKYKYGNWIDSIPTLTQSGTYTLYALGSETNENVCYKIPTDLSYQFFVVEYRKTTKEFETALPGSGLLVYRIDTRYEGNADYNGNNVLDEVYIFRPGGSPRTSGYVNRANLSSSVNRPAFSPLTDPYPFLTNGARAYLEITNISDNNGDSITFDYNIMTCPPPQNVGAFGIAPTSAVLRWMGVVQTEGYQVEYGLQGFTLGTGTRVFTNTNTYTLTGLTPSTDYEFYVRPVCGEGDTGMWTTVTEFTTACPVHYLPLIEGFESEEYGCWGQEYVLGTKNWGFENGSRSGSSSAHTGQRNILFYKNVYEDGSFVTKYISPYIDLNTVTNPHLTFWHKQREITESYGGQDELRVYYRNSPTESWTLLAEYTQNISTWTFDSIPLPNPTELYQIAFEGTANGGYGVVVDDVTVKGTPIYRQVVASVNNAQYGSVSGVGTYGMGTEVTLVAEPANDCQFVCWGDYNTDDTIRFTVMYDTTVSAIFTTNAQDMYIVRLNVNDTNMGSATGTGVYVENTTATLTAIAKANYRFHNWSDGITANPRNLTVTSNLTLEAVFVPDTFMISTEVNDETMGRIEGAGRYAYNTWAELTAIPYENYRFESWVDGNTDNPRRVLVTGNETYMVDFVPIYYSITVTSDNETMGSVYGTDNYQFNSVANISAYPNQGYIFTHWNDGNTENPRNIVVTQDSSFVAYFAKSDGIEDCDRYEDLFIYPNPTSKMVYVNTDEVKRIDVMDMHGRVLMSKENVSEMNVESLPDGVYTLKIILPNGEVLKRMMKVN